MSYQSSLLIKIINDESFLRWLEGEASISEKKEWDKWLVRNPIHQRILKKAKKIRKMPFVECEVQKDISAELERIHEKIQAKEVSVSQNK